MIVDNIQYALLSLIPALLNAGILIYLLFFIPKGKTTGIFSFFVIALILWQIEDTIVRLGDSDETVRYWDRILCIGWAGVAPLVFHFASRYASSKAFSSRFALTCIYLPFIVFYIIYMAGDTATQIRYSENWGRVIEPRDGTLDGLHRTFISLYVTAAVFILFKYAFSIKDNKARKLQAFVIAVGILIPTIQGVITQIIFPVVLDRDEIPVTSSFMTFYSLATIVAIRRFRFFNISESV